MDKDMLMKARNEIVRLRRQNEVLGAQMDVVEVFATALGLRRNTTMGLTEDVVPQLDRAIEEAGKPQAARA